VSEPWEAGPGSQQKGFLLLTAATAYCHCGFGVLFGFFKGEFSIMGQNIQALALCLWLQNIHSDLVLLSKKNSWTDRRLCQHASVLWAASYNF